MNVVIFVINPLLAKFDLAESFISNTRSRKLRNLSYAIGSHIKFPLETKIFLSNFVGTPFFTHQEQNIYMELLCIHCTHCNNL